MAATPTVTVVVPTYNRADLLPLTLDSVFRQTFRDFELLVIDDGSTDDTDAALARYDDERLRLELNSENLGLPRTRNRGLDLARGRYVANLDSDDLVEPEWLAKGVAFLEANSNVALVGVGKRPMSGISSPAQSFRYRPRAPEAIRARLLFRSCITNSSLIARTEVMRAFRYDESFPVVEDFELFARLADRYDLANLPDRLMRVRRHRGRVTHRRDLVTECQKKVLAAQLDRLEMDWSAADLDTHFRLGRPGSWHRPKREELPEAEAWLQRLMAANEATGRYPKEAFERALGEVWIELWSKAMPGSLFGLGRWFRASPMAGLARRCFAERWRSLTGGPARP